MSRLQHLRELRTRFLRKLGANITDQHKVISAFMREEIDGARLFGAMSSLARDATLLRGAIDTLTRMARNAS